MRPMTKNRIIEPVNWPTELSLQLSDHPCNLAISPNTITYVGDPDPNLKYRGECL